MTDKGYYPYVFDAVKRAFVGRFEDMYQAESSEGFDSWHQDDLRHLPKRVCLQVLADYNFSTVLDVGCGKGMLTQYLKKRNNQVIAIDLSETALKTARGRYPDIQFVNIDISTPDFNIGALGERFELVSCMEALSYIESWRKVLAQFAQHSIYTLVALFVPEEPMGFIKSADDLATEFVRHFHLIEDIRFRPRGQIILFGKSRKAGA
jgi:predicted TPR repeat methyltransferase